MALARPVWRSDYANSRQLSPLETFTRASAASRMTKVGALAQAAANQPRFDYDPATMACRGLLLEPSATNLGTQSEFSNGLADAASQSGAVSASTMTGFAGAIAFTAAGANAWVYKSFAFAASSTYTVSAIVEMTDGLAPVFPSGTAAAASNDFGFSIANAGVAPQRVEYLGGIRYRVSASTTTGGAPAASWGVVKYSSNSSRTFKVTGYQLETGGVVTSYIPTAGATATRVADSLSVSGADFARIWRADEWVIAVEGVLPASLPVTGNRHLLYLGDGGESNRIAIAYNHATGRVEAAILQGGVVLVNQAVGPAIAAGQSVRVGVSCKTGSAFLVAVNGTSYAGAVVPAALSANTLILGAYLFAERHWGATIVRAAMHARYATLDELIEVTR